MLRLLEAPGLIAGWPRFRGPTFRARWRSGFAPAAVPAACRRRPLLGSEGMNRIVGLNRPDRRGDHPPRCPTSLVAFAPELGGLTRSHSRRIWAVIADYAHRSRQDFRVGCHSAFPAFLLLRHLADTSNRVCGRMVPSCLGYSGSRPRANLSWRGRNVCSGDVVAPNDCPNNMAPQGRTASSVI